MKLTYPSVYKGLTLIIHILALIIFYYRLNSLNQGC